MNATRLVLIAAILATTTLSCSRPIPERNVAADEQSVTQVGVREIRAFAAGDIAGNLAAMTEDVVLMPPNEPMREGKDAMREWLERTHDKFTLDVRYIDSDVHIAGDTAIQRYVGVGKLTPKAGGAPIEAQFKGIHIYRRQPDGSWLIWQDIWNSDLPAAPPAPDSEKKAGI